MSIPAIETITLTDALPRVFLDEPSRPSDVWRTQLTFRRGERYIIEAESGTGKSSLCAYIYGNRTDFAGSITFNGNLNSTTLSIADWQELRRRHIAYLPQELALFPELTAMQNIRLKNVLTDEISEQQIASWLKELGIDSRADFPVGKMSIGQQQRVAIIRTLCQPFDFILLDEPVSHLDPGNNRIAARIIAAEAERRGAAIIATSVGNPIEIPGMATLHL